MPLLSGTLHCTLSHYAKLPSFLLPSPNLCSSTLYSTLLHSTLFWSPPPPHYATPLLTTLQHFAPLHLTPLHYTLLLAIPLHHTPLSSTPLQSPLHSTQLHLKMCQGNDYKLLMNLSITARVLCSMSYKALNLLHCKLKACTKSTS